MISRQANNLHQDSSSTDAAAKLAISYVTDFSIQAKHYRSQKSDESLVMLNRSASLLSTAIQPQHFTPASLEISKFFIDLHAVVDSLSADSDALWACIAVLQQCSRNLDARRALVDDFRFVPLLTFLLKRTQGQDRVQRLLTLLQELSYGIQINWEEPYLIVLIELLVHIIYNAEADEEAHAQLALSILVNLCYKNFVVLFLFLRTVNISSFSRKIINYGMLANKMMIILSEDIGTPDMKDMHSFLRSTLTVTVDECIKQWNVPYLRHIVGFLMDSDAHNGLHLAMLNYEHYCEDIEKMLDHLESRSGMDDSSEESRKQQQLCMSLLFQLVRYILELSTVPNNDGSENRISLNSNIPRIFEWLCNWIESDVCGADAVNLLESLVRLTKKESISARISRDPSIIIQLIATSEKPETSAQHTTSILTLVLTLLRQSKTEKLILSKFTESYFDKVFASLLAIKPELCSTNSIPVAEIERSIFCLLLIINFAGIAKKAYYEKCCTLLQMPQIQIALARAMVTGSESVCDAVFQISQFEHFPHLQVAKYVSMLNTACKNIVHAPPNDQWSNFNSIMKSHQTFVSKEIEERLDALITLISNANQNNQLNNVETSQIINLFNYKLEKFNSSESSMRNRLDEASNEITKLTQRIHLQNEELQKLHAMNFELHIYKEGLQTKCKDLKEQIGNLKRGNADLMKKLSEQSESLQINEKRLTMKVSEVIVLQKECTELKESLQTKTDELEKLQATSKENASRIDKLKKTISAYEVDIKEKERSIAEKERDLAKTHKALEEQKEAKRKSDDVITVLESQLQEKNEQIRSYELELSETEELRKTILSLMESKKPKRK